MRTISANGLAKLAEKQGTEPVIILEVQWADDASVMRYGDTEVPGESVSGTILEVGGLDNVITISGVSQGTVGDSQQLTFTLDDTDGSVKNILDQTDVHKRPAWVYQWYKGLDFSDRFLLFKGLISSPIEWHEGDRTVRFDVMQQIEDIEYGFSIEQGNFEYVDPSLIGKAWPLCFGTPIHVPALRTRSPYTGILQTPFGIADFTLAARLEQLKSVCCPLVFRGFHIRLTLSGQTAHTVFMPEPGCYCRKKGTIAEWEAELALQNSYSIQPGQTLQIINGELFPQNQIINIKVCDAAVLRGTFAGKTFTVLSATHPQEFELTVPPVKSRTVCAVRSLNLLNPGGFAGGDIPQYASRDQVLFHITRCGETDDSHGLGWEYLATFPHADFYWAEPGCEVVLVGNEEIPYICNILPSTILRVAAYRTFPDTGVRQLVSVPTSRYTTRITDFGGYNVTEVVMNKPLSRYGEGYEDDIYVTLTSSVGPNTVDILIWLINKYTSFSYDSTTFNAVKTKLTEYPMHFPLLDRGNILDLLRDIAFQARCALILRNDTFYLIYLSEEPSSDFTINETDVLPETFVLSHTETEELVTKFVARWKHDHAIDDPNTAIYRYNVARYGTQEQEFDFFALDHIQLVEKTATFWLIRMANTWRKIQCRTPLTKLQAEVFDIASVTLPDFSLSTIKCIVEEATYNSENHEIDFVLWTPVRSGEQSAYDFAWPANIDTTLIFPTIEDHQQGKAGGSGPNVDVEPPGSHPLAAPQGFTAHFQTTNCGRRAGVAPITPPGDPGNPYCRPDQGDSQPSDQDDQAPTKEVPGSGETDVGTAKNPIGARSSEIIDVEQALAEQEAQSQGNTNANNPNSGDGGGGDGDQDPMDSLPEEPPDCSAGVRFCVSDVGIVKKEDDTISAEEGDMGQALGFGVIDVAEKCSNIWFNSREAADAYGAALKELANSYNATVGQPWIVGALSGRLTLIDKWGPECEEPPEDERAMNAGSRPGDPQRWEDIKDINDEWL
jgi:hypothetical protein